MIVLQCCAVLPSGRSYASPCNLADDNKQNAVTRPGQVPGDVFYHCTRWTMDHSFAPQLCLMAMECIMRSSFPKYVYRRIVHINLGDPKRGLIFGALVWRTSAHLHIVNGRDVLWAKGNYSSRTRGSVL